MSAEGLCEEVVEMSEPFTIEEVNKWWAWCLHGGPYPCEDRPTLLRDIAELAIAQHAELEALRVRLAEAQAEIGRMHTVVKAAVSCVHDNWPQIRLVLLEAVHDYEKVKP